MSTARSIALRVGIVGGVLFALHISMPNGGNYPFIWPALAGAVAFWMASRATAVHRLRQGVLGALATSVVVALVGFVGVSLIVFVAGHSQFSDVAAESGLHGRLLVLVQAASMIGALCALAMVAAILGAAVAMPVAWLRDQRSGAPAA